MRKRYSKEEEGKRDTYIQQGKGDEERCSKEAERKGDTVLKE